MSSASFVVCTVALCARRYVPSRVYGLTPLPAFDECKSEYKMWSAPSGLRYAREGMSPLVLTNWPSERYQPIPAFHLSWGDPGSLAVETLKSSCLPVPGIGTCV